MVKTATQAHDVVARVVDPEIPVLTIEDLGVLRGVDQVGDTIVVTITPTYSGCPAMGQIEDDITRALRRAGYSDIRIDVVYQPAWTTEWMSDEARSKLEDFGIAPPTAPSDVRCPKCREGEARLIAQFGSTACKALMVCSVCGDPFDYFKEH
ncbi:MAG TPA: 1,2-phenylacetyl-CoA epoxidase subunit PaaD [Acidimicrobiia bacterium]|nr:1,2-phenylacetyl-CoA epoxidase subunit PaaD [Acidimicrobiia bacterium]